MTGVCRHAIHEPGASVHLWTGGRDYTGAISDKFLVFSLRHQRSTALLLGSGLNNGQKSTTPQSAADGVCHLGVHYREIPGQMPHNRMNINGSGHMPRLSPAHLRIVIGQVSDQSVPGSVPLLSMWGQAISPPIAPDCCE